MRKVKILGAGPSGLSAGINLAIAGYEVVVFEKSGEVGRRFNGDFQGLENWSDREDVQKMLKRMNIEFNFDLDSFSELTISNGYRQVNFSLDRPAFYLVRRGSFPGSLDVGLKKQALALGVDIRFGEMTSEENVDIVATGPVSKATPAIVKGICFRTEMEDMALILFNNNTAYKGYSYLLVSDGHGCMCTVTFEKFEMVGSCFGETKRVFSEMVDLDVKESRKIAGVGNFSVGGVLEKDGRLYIGEAAGLQDFLWGFGIKKAITSGYLAAKSIIEEKNYQKIAKDHFENGLKASVVNRFLWELLGWNDYSFLIDVLESANEPLNFLLSFHNFNFVQRMLYPFALRSVKRRYRDLKF